MGKLITSPVKRYPGTVTLSDPLTYPQVFAVEDAIAAVQGLVRDAPDQMPSMHRVRYAWLPAIFKVVERWDLQNVPDPLTVDTFPASPRLAAARLIEWLINEITALFEDENEIPNA